MANSYPVKQASLTGSNDKFEYLQQELEQRAKVKGITPVDLLSLPATINNVFDKIMRRGLITLSEMADELDFTELQASHLATLLINKGYLRPADSSTNEEPSYQIRFTVKRKRRMPPNIWQALE